MKKYTEQEVFDASLEYFEGDSLAAKAFTDKYAMRNGEDFYELTPADMHFRLANEFVRAEHKFSNPLDISTIFSSVEKFKKIVPQGSPMYGMGHRYSLVSLSNCVVVDSPRDSVQGIMDTGAELANLYKRRAGVGVDISTLRPEGARTNNSSGTTTGAWSFSDFFSYITRMIGQNGRRGALMITMDVHHPDILSFARMKTEKEKVTGANISVMIDDDFMQAVENDAEYTQKWPCNVPDEEATIVRKVKARDVWHVINQAAAGELGEGGEPGLIFADNYRRELPANYYDDFKFLTVNPCSEIGLSAYDSCRLISINLTGFVQNPFCVNSEFDWEDFEKTVAIAARLADDLVELEIEHLTKIIDTVKDEPTERAVWMKLRDAAVKGRRTGLGTHGLADMLAQLTIKYDSETAIEFVDKLYAVLRNTAYKTSVELAEERGPFPAFDWSKEKACPFIQRLPKDLQLRMKKSGRRNISMLTNAPTGTVAIVSQTSSGIEPLFRNEYTRWKKINPSDLTSRVDRVDENGDKWQEFKVYEHNPKRYVELIGNPVLPEYFVTSEQIDASMRVEIQGTIQKYIDHGISSTINLPKGTKAEVVEKIYELAWKFGLKGITVYVDGSRGSAVLTTSSSYEEGIKDVHAPKRPEKLPCDIHHVTVSGKKWTVLVGLLNDRPYELFGGPAESVELPKRLKSGFVSKRKCEKINRKGRLHCYDLFIGTGEDEMKVKDIGVNFSPENEDYGVMTRMLSLSLRHGVPVHFIVEQLGRDQDSHLHSFSKVMARVLKKYVSDGVKSGEACSNCGEKLVFEDGCFICKSCAFSKCS